MNRRNFVQRMGSFALLSFAGSFSLALTGCNAFTDIEAWVPVGIAAVNSIVKLLGAFLPPGASAIITLVLAGLTDLAQAVRDYNADQNPADKATLLAKIRTLLTDIAKNFQDVLNAAAGNNPIIGIVLALAQVFLSALAGFLGELPAASAPKMVRLGSQTLPVTPKRYKKPAGFVTDFNNVCVRLNHPEAEIK